jgi:predicted enzyme related to lactoylglutathione lyase
VPAFPGIAHVAVTVSDLEQSTAWYSALFGSDPVLDEDEQSGDFHHTVFAIDGGQLFGLHTHPEPNDEKFDERRPGLDHVSFACRDRNELAARACGSPNWASLTRASKMPAMDRAFRSETPTGSPWSSSLRRPD